MKKSRNAETTTYAQMGVAALLPGMQWMIERMQAELDQMRAFLAGMQNPDVDEPAGKGWPADPAARSAEMLRRMAVSREKKLMAMGPSDRNHPEHAAWAAKVRKQRLATWKAMKPSQRKARLAAMAAGRAKAAKARRKNHDMARELINGLPREAQVQ